MLSLLIRPTWLRLRPCRKLELFQDGLLEVRLQETSLIDFTSLCIPCIFVTESLPKMFSTIVHYLMIFKKEQLCNTFLKITKQCFIVGNVLDSNSLIEYNTLKCKNSQKTQSKAQPTCVPLRSDSPFVGCMCAIIVELWKEPHVINV